MITINPSSGPQVYSHAKDELTITPLGAGQEVGRSAVLLKFKGKTVLFDCGIHPAHTGMGSLPFFDSIEPSSIDLCLVTHFHLDHSGAVPYLMQKTDFRGRMYMTHPTKAICKMILSDFVRVTDVSASDALFNEEDLSKSMDAVELIDYHQEKQHKGIKFWCYNAGHVLGAAMFMVEIAGIRVLYTGDYSREADRHLLGAEIPAISPDVLIVESTYGIHTHRPRREREHEFTKMVERVVKRGGKCLLPVFALGRAQELLLILDDFWDSHPELRRVPIYYASSLAQKCMSVFKKYINMMNDSIRKQFEVSNPFESQHINNLRSARELEGYTGPCVVLASPGMLQSGLSQELFEMWCQDPKNGVVIPGYCVEGTLAHRILSKPSEVVLSSGESVPLRLSVDSISFSAHSDVNQTEDFINKIQPCEHIVLVHGDRKNCERLRRHLSEKNENFNVYTPGNCTSVKISFKREKIAKVLGSLASSAPSNGTQVSGVLLQKDFQHHLVAPEDLRLYSDINCATVFQKLHVPLPQPTVSTSKDAEALAQYWKAKIEKKYQPVEIVSINPQKQMTDFKHEKNEDEMEDEETTEESKIFALNIANCLQLVLDPKKLDEAFLEWTTGAKNDLLVNGVLHLLLGNEEDESEDIQDESRLLYIVHTLLRQNYSTVDLDVKERQVAIKMNGKVVALVDSYGRVSSDNAPLKRRLDMAMKRIILSVFPMPHAMGCLEE
eukprot:CAMPEP_0117448304 /NCGR_PEP_ID=MMETSP0759-20121206/7330_1 /TAXON_ID=63605 /ORGANISM="Percolomonas cosmopolitus, Strain WS" /LENGTH=722 /DNA_ID=CAMNT_0005240683 /DNA_START=418 /DNA_END=2586 /DNA_ORIENTATION=+